MPPTKDNRMEIFMRINQLSDNVTIIPATKRSVQNNEQFKERSNLRVAAYCRVSTGSDSQRTSYATQRAFYRTMIAHQEGWKFAGIYADEALSGTSRIHRVEFNRMMEDAKAGKIDYIVSKSISRFARNTVDTLTCIRELRQQNPPVGVFFEKENIDTLDAKGELILTILSALAQDESRSISDNIRWSFQKNFQAGKPHVNLKRMLGYDKDTDGNWIIIPEQAEIVRYIFERFVCGQTANKIAKELNAMGKTTINGNKWIAGGVLIVLRNEKYVGDVEMQKTITKDFLTHRSVANKGEAPKYYVKNHHEGIIDRITWDKVQAILCSKTYKQEETQSPKGHKMKKSPFVNLICGETLEPFFRITYTGIAAGYTDERSLAATGGDMSIFLEKYSYAYPVWRCKRTKNSKFCSDRNDSQSLNETCPSQILHECAIEQSFMEMLYQLKRNYESEKEASDIYQLFREASQKVSEKNIQNGISVSRIDNITLQLTELRQEYENILTTQVDTIGQIVLEKNHKLRESIANEELTMDEIEIDIRNSLMKGIPFTRLYCIDIESNTEVKKSSIHLQDILKKIEILQKEQNTLKAEQNVLLTMNRNFEFFLNCLMALPEQNEVGQKLTINGIDTEKSINDAWDLLHFEKGIYCAFIERGIVYGDIIEYTTNFGVILKSKRNSRNLKHFLGYRKYTIQKEEILIDAPYKIYDNHIQYRRYPDRRKLRKENSKQSAHKNMSVRL